MKCCGVTGPNDWNDNVYFNCTNDMNKSGEKCGVPHSCCINVFNFYILCNSLFLRLRKAGATSQPIEDVPENIPFS